MAKARLKTPALSIPVPADRDACAIAIKNLGYNAPAYTARGFDAAISPGQNMASRGQPRQLGLHAIDLGVELGLEQSRYWNKRIPAQCVVLTIQQIVGHGRKGIVAGLLPREDDVAIVQLNDVGQVLAGIDSVATDNQLSAEPIALDVDPLRQNAMIATGI